MVYCNIDNIKEFERVEAEEAEAKKICVAANIQIIVFKKSQIVRADSSFKGFDWDSVNVDNIVIN